MESATVNILIVWSVLGLISGMAAKWILPGEDKGGLISTIVIGVMGSFLGGYLGQYFGISGVVGGISIASFATAIVGALVLLIGFRVLKLLI